MKRPYLRNYTSWNDGIDITMTVIPKFIFMFHTYGSMFDRTGLLSIEVYTVGIGIFDLFGSCDLDLDPMTFKYELDP